MTFKTRIPESAMRVIVDEYYADAAYSGGGSFARFVRDRYQFEMDTSKDMWLGMHQFKSEADYLVFLMKIL